MGLLPGWIYLLSLYRVGLLLGEFWLLSIPNVGLLMGRPKIRPVPDVGFYFTLSSEGNTNKAFFLQTKFNTMKLPSFTICPVIPFYWFAI